MTQTPTAESWAGYDPDTDDYDCRTTHLQPSIHHKDDITLKQIAALRGRVEKGGDWFVVAHYQSVIREMKHSLSGAVGLSIHPPSLMLCECQHPPPVKYFSHKRGGSMQSNSTTASTCCPEDENVCDDDRFGEIDNDIDEIVSTHRTKMPTMPPRVSMTPKLNLPQRHGRSTIQAPFSGPALRTVVDPRRLTPSSLPCSWAANNQAAKHCRSSSAYGTVRLGSLPACTLLSGGTSPAAPKVNMPVLPALLQKS